MSRATTNMGNWGATDTVDVTHEFGHMLGALEEYFTVNGIAWGAARQASGAIMNNPANPPVARHYDSSDRRQGPSAARPTQEGAGNQLLNQAVALVAGLTIDPPEAGAAEPHHGAQTDECGWASRACR